MSRQLTVVAVAIASAILTSHGLYFIANGWWLHALQQPGVLS